MYFWIQKHHDRKIPESQVNTQSSTSVIISHYIRFPYRQGFEWWESVLIGQVLMLSCVRIWNTNPLTASVISIFFTYIGLACHMYAMPFRSRLINFIQFIFNVFLTLIPLLSIPSDIMSVTSNEEESELGFSMEAVHVMQSLVCWSPFVLIVALRITRVIVTRLQPNCCKPVFKY